MDSITGREPCAGSIVPMAIGRGPGRGMRTGGLVVEAGQGGAVKRGTAMVHRLVACAAYLLMVVPGLALALDLGPIESRSALFEPLDARIPMRDVQPGDIEGLNVTLGSPAQFELAGVARLQHLDLLEFTVVSQSDGGGYIQVSTDEPIIESSLTFLVDVDWPRGRAVRGYRLHLSPTPRIAVAGTPGTRAAPEVQPETAPSAAAPASPPAGVATYGPVRSSDTLWSIASRLRPDRSVSVQRMMLAVLEANPDAFAIPNVNALNENAVLRIPSREEIGADDLTAAIAEVERQHEAWKAYRESGRAAPAPAAPAAPSDPTPEPSGRIEVVSPETPVAGRAPDADTRALRNQLALAVEEADARRRQNDELTLRLTEAEDHIRELSRLVELKNEEIAALQARLQAIAETAPTPAPSEMEPMPAPAPTEMEPMPTPAPSELEVTPAPAVVTSDEVRPDTMPFGLGALPVNPVFLVGGAGLLLILLGVIALLRRRRASAGDDELSERAADPETESSAASQAAVAEADGGSAGDDDNLLRELEAAAETEAGSVSPGADDNLLRELEAVASDLADETDDRRPFDGRAAPSADFSEGADLEAPEREFLRFERDDLPDERMENLWPDEPETERALLEELDADAETADITFDLDALADDESDSSTQQDGTDDDFDIRDLTDLAELAAASEEDAGSTLGEAADDIRGDLDLLFGDREGREIDADAPSSAAADGGGDPLDLVGLPDDAGRGAPDDGRDGDGSLASGFGAVDTTEPGVDRASAPKARTGDGRESREDDPRALGSPSQALFDEATDDGETEAFSLDGLGEDEVQTKIDLAQVYMEMGDTDSARGFLEAVLAEGDADQQEAAREMLSKLA